MCNHCLPHPDEGQEVFERYEDELDARERELDLDRYAPVKDEPGPQPQLVGAHKEG